jgi:hypothetical protein
MYSGSRAVAIVATQLPDKSAAEHTFPAATNPTSNTAIIPCFLVIQFS